MWFGLYVVTLTNIELSEGIPAIDILIALKYSLAHVLRLLQLSDMETRNGMEQNSAYIFLSSVIYNTGLKQKYYWWFDSYI